MSALIGALRVTLGLDSAAFERDAKRAQGTVGGLAGTFGKAAGLMGGLVAAAGLTNLAGQAFEFASGLSEAADRAGVTVEKLQELQFAATQSGVSTELLESSLQKMSRSIGQAAGGSKSMTAALQSIGLTVDELKGKSPDQQFRLIAEALKNTTDEGTRAAAGAVLLSRGYADMVPMIKGGAAALDEASKAARANGVLTQKEADDLDNLADSWERLKTKVLLVTARIMAQLVPFAKKLDEWEAQWDAALGRAGKSLDDLQARWDRALNRMGRQMGEWLRGLDNGAGRIHASLLTLAGEGGFQLASFGDSAESVSVRVQKTFKDMADATLGALDRLRGAIQGGGFLDILSAVIGLGLQLGSTGLFGKSVANRINGVQASTPAPTIPSLSGSFQTVGLSRGTPANNNSVVTIVPTPYFDAQVQGQASVVVARSAPSIARGTMAKLAYTGSRRLA